VQTVNCTASCYAREHAPFISLVFLAPIHVHLSSRALYLLSRDLVEYISTNLPLLRQGGVGEWVRVLCVCV
jgi:hypothetical protein